MRPTPLLLWTGCEISRRKGMATMVAIALFALTTLVALVMVLQRNVAQTVDSLLDASPAIVVRRIDSGGWMPLPTQAALAAATTIPGVINPRVRVWGTGYAGAQPVTIVGIQDGPHRLLPRGTRVPRQGEALIGPGVDMGLVDRSSIEILGQIALAFQVRAILPETAAPAVHDLILLHIEDARRLLGLRPEQSSDLVLDVFRAEEIAPLSRVLTTSFPWPVQVIDRQMVQKTYARHFAAREAAGMVLHLPALLALAVLLMAVAPAARMDRHSIGVLKSLGWTSRDLMTVHFVRAIMIGTPAVAAGSAMAMAFCVLPIHGWLSQLLFQWHGPVLAFDFHATVTALAMAAAFVLVPYLIASFWTGWVLIRTDPLDLIQGVP